MCWRVVPFRCILKIYMWFNSTRGLEGTFFLRFFPLFFFRAMSAKPRSSVPAAAPGRSQMPLGAKECVSGQAQPCCPAAQTEMYPGFRTAATAWATCTRHKDKDWASAAPEHGPLEQPWSRAPSLLQQGGLCLLFSSGGQDEAQL